MAQETLDFTVPTTTSTGDPTTTTLHVVLSLSDVPNSDGSYTVIGATGTFGTMNIVGLAPLLEDGSDNKVFLGGAQPILDFNGVTLITDGTPNGATGLGVSTWPAQDLNVFYNVDPSTGTGYYAIDTWPTTVISDPTASFDPFCFVRGTRILTDKGEAPIETLKPGDRVMTADGSARPVRWLGRQTVSTVFADPQRAWPIRVRAGALADNAPARDLLLSPDHALFLDGALIQAAALVNGTSVLRETDVAEIVEYYHVELDAPALVLAEGAAAESFVDDEGRRRFDNWREYEALDATGRSVEGLPYPRAKSCRQVAAATRARLAARAGLLSTAGCALVA